MIHGLDIDWNSISLNAVFGECYVQQVRRRLIGGVRNQRVQIPGRDGSFVFEERRGTRMITADVVLVSGAIVGRRDDLVLIADWLDYTGESRLILSDQPDQFWLASVVTDPDPDEWKRTGKFKLEWEAQPYAYALDISSEAMAPTGGPSGGVDNSSFSIPDSLDAYPEVTITPSGGDIVSLTWRLNGTEITWGGSLPAASVLNISSLSDTITTGVSDDTQLTGAFDPLDVSMAVSNGAFGMLQPGINTWHFSWAGTATTVNIVVRWRRRFR